jgi:hypothetical protein
VARGHFVVDITIKKIVDVYSRILMIFAKDVTTVRKLED